MFVSDQRERAKSWRPPHLPGGPAALHFDLDFHLTVRIDDGFFRQSDLHTFPFLAECTPDNHIPIRPIVILLMHILFKLLDRLDGREGSLGMHG
jgi:hypothetical protein